MSALGSRQAGIGGSVTTTGQLLPMGYLLQKPARQQGTDGRIPRYVVQGALPCREVPDRISISVDGAPKLFYLKVK